MKILSLYWEDAKNNRQTEHLGAYWEKVSIDLSVVLYTFVLICFNLKYLVNTLKALPSLSFILTSFSHHCVTVLYFVKIAGKFLELVYKIKHKCAIFLYTETKETSAEVVRVHL